MGKRWNDQSLAKKEGRKGLTSAQAVVPFWNTWKNKVKHVENIIAER
jgi:hypothetical protein